MYDIYTHSHTHIRTYPLSPAPALTRIRILIYTRTHPHTHTHTCTTCIARTSAHTGTRTRMYIRIRKPEQTRTRMHLHTHTHAGRRDKSSHVLGHAPNRKISLVHHGAGDLFHHSHSVRVEHTLPYTQHPRDVSVDQGVVPERFAQVSGRQTCAGSHLGFNGD